jgi:putative PIN family toxin of toxin-antitoxin system
VITVINSNVIVSGHISTAGPPALVLAAWKERRFDVLASEQILAEYRRALRYDRVRARHGLSDAEIEQTIEDFRGFTALVEPLISLHAIQKDPTDNKFLECAVEGGADYIVSGDKHLRRLERFRGIEIVSPAAFLALLARIDGFERR